MSTELLDRPVSSAERLDTPTVHASDLPHSSEPRTSYQVIRGGNLPPTPPTGDGEDHSGNPDRNNKLALLTKVIHVARIGLPTTVAVGMIAAEFFTNVAK